MVSFHHPNIMSRNNPKLPHNRLVENSAVLSLQEPPHEKLSDFTMSYIPQHSRNGYYSQNGYQGNFSLPLPCDRCGTSHRDFRFCKALTRKCYKCRRYGHYASHCAFSVDPSIVHKQPFVNEDSDCESEDSFCSVDSTPCAMEAHILELSVEHSSPRSDSSAAKQCQLLQDQNKELSEQVSQLENSLCNTEQKLNHAESQVRSVFQYTVKLMEACVKLEHMTLHLQDEFEERDDQCMAIAAEIGDNLCSKCGCVHVDLTREEGELCPDDLSRCCRCGDREHLTAQCDEDLPCSAVLDEETLHLLYTLVQTTGTHLSEFIHCNQCDYPTTIMEELSVVFYPNRWEPHDLDRVIESVVKQVQN